MSNGEGEVETQELTGEQLGEVIMGRSRGGRSVEAQRTLDNLSENPSDFLHLVAGEREIPNTIIDATLESFFGEVQDSSSSLEQKRNSCQESMNEIKDAFSEQGLGIIKGELIRVISLDPGLGTFFNRLTPRQQDIFIDEIIKTELMQRIGKQKFIQTLTESESGGHKYQALQDEVEELDRRIKVYKTELGGLDQETSSSRAGISEASIPDYESRNEALTNENSEMMSLINEINGEIKGGTVPTERAEITLLRRRIKSYNEKIRVNKLKITNNQTVIDKARTKKANEERRDKIEGELSKLGEDRTKKNGELNEARNDFSKKFGEFSGELQTVFSDAAKDTLEELKNRATNANAIGLQKEGEEMEERGREEGNKVAQAVGEVTKELATMYIDTHKVGGSFLRPEKVVSKIKVGDLRKNFDKMMTNSSETCIKIIDKVLENSELNNYFNQNPEARKKLNQQMEEKIFLETTQNAVMHLKLDRRTLEALGTMPEFRKAVTNAIQAKKETRETIEELIDEDLGSKGGIRKLWEKMPLGGGIGAILMLLTMLGLVVGGKKFVGSK